VCEGEGVGGTAGGWTVHMVIGYAIGYAHGLARPKPSGALRGVGPCLSSPTQ
jgi:hypothetical protein